MRSKYPTLMCWEPYSDKKTVSVPSKGKVNEGPITYFRLSTDDPKGKTKTYLEEAEFTNNPYGMDGGIAVTRVPNLQKLMKYLCKNGFEHHVAMGRGNMGEVLREAVETYLNWDLYVHE